MRNWKRWLLIALAAVMVLGGAFIIWKSDERVDVVLDPGHGDHDAGAANGDRLEKDDNLALALATAELLKHQGVNVRLTREDDRFVSLKKRCSLANRRHAALFVSLHRNSAEGAKGVEIWIGSENDPDSRALAQAIMDGLDAAGISKNRGVKTGYAQGIGDYYVNKHTRMPSCLVELGFITSDEDNALFDAHLADYADALAQAIRAQLPAREDAATAGETTSAADGPSGADPIK
ncbi:MAG: N-acetylmuramoyl-L-alanine amidase [Clostridia bacterium]|nr:N-acetylmuramoyl-L-alanine amidase [Clostridia bacterium]